MSDELSYNEEPSESEIPEGFDELELLKRRADLLGISYHHKAGASKIKHQIEQKLREQNSESSYIEDEYDSEPVRKKDNDVIVNPVTGKAVKIYSHAEFSKLQSSKRKREAGKLIRINITCMNPEKANWEGEIISVGSAKMGTYKKYVPFNTTDGWHVPYAMYEVLKNRKCCIFQTVKDQLGNKVRKAKLIKEFNIEVLPPLTKDELKELARKQAMSGAIDSTNS